MSNYMFTAADQVLDALSTAYAATSSPPALFEHRPGTQVVMDAGLTRDLCCEGLCVVMLGDTQPIEGAQASDGPICVNQDFVVAVMRCAPTIDDMGNVPTSAENAACAELISDDKDLMLRTVKELIRTAQMGANGYEPVSDEDYQNVIAGTLGPSGGCVATVLTFTLPLFEDC